jgi:ABC-type antimicrobial peptide transport system permease subunit
MAVGAQREQIGAQFLKIGLRLLITGTVIGLIGAALSGRALQSLLYDVPPLNPATFAATAAIMTVVCLVACWLPARRASLINPIEALRTE